MTSIIVYILATMIGMNSGPEVVESPLTVIEETPVIEVHEASPRESNSLPEDFPLDVKEITSDYQGSLDVFSKYKNLESLELHGRSDLTGIESLKALKQLILSPKYKSDDYGAEITIDLSKISNLESLSVFGHVNGSKVTFIKTHDPMHIKKLNLHIVDVNNINALGALSELSSLEIENCNADEPINLSNFKNLETLTNRGLTVQNRIDLISFDNTFISELNALQSLVWYEKRSVQPNGLEQQKHLKSLELYGFAFDTYDLTESHPMLERVSFEKCSFDTLAIENHPALNSLVFANAQMSLLKLHSNLNLESGYIYQLDLGKLNGLDDLLSIPYLTIEGGIDNFVSQLKGK